MRFVPRTTQCQWCGDGRLQESWPLIDVPLMPQVRISALSEISFVSYLIGILFNERCPVGYSPDSSLEEIKKSLTYAVSVKYSPPKRQQNSGMHLNMYDEDLNFC